MLLWLFLLVLIQMPYFRAQGNKRLPKERIKLMYSKTVIDNLNYSKRLQQMNSSIERSKHLTLKLADKILISRPINL